jgi:phosphohistidine phosphatase SixA
MRLSWILALVVVSLSSSATAHQGIFIVRHAEKASLTDPDTPLSMQGEDRALALARLLRSAGVSHVFVTDRKRTQQTAANLAEQRRLTPIVVPVDKTADLLARLQTLPADAVAVVVGHSDTIPELLKGLGVSKRVEVKDDQYGRVFLVTGAGNLLELSY